MGTNAQKITAAFGIAIELAAGVMDALPDIRELIEKCSVNEHELSTLISSIGDDDAVVCVSSDMSSLTEINQELLREGIPFSMVEAGPFSVLFNTDTDMITLLPSRYRDRARDVIENYIDREQERDAAYFESDSEGSEGTEEDDAEGEESRGGEEDDDREEDLSGYDSEAHPDKKKGSGKAKRGMVSASAGTPAKDQGMEKPSGTDNGYVSIGSAGSLYEGHDRKGSVIPEGNATRDDGHKAGQTTPVTDIKRSGSGEGRQEESREGRGINASDTVHDGRALSDGIHGQDTVKRQGQEDTADDRRESCNVRGARRHTAHSTVSGRAVVNTGTADVRTGDVPSSSGRTRTGTPAFDADIFRDVAKAGTADSAHGGRSNITISVHGARKGSHGETLVDFSSLGRKTSIGVKDRDVRSAMTAAYIASSPHFTRALGHARMMMGEIAAPRDTEGGRGMHSVLNIVQPVSSVIYARFMRDGVVSINQNISFDENIFTRALYSQKGLSSAGTVRVNAVGIPRYSMEDAVVDVRAFMEDFAATESGIPGNMAQLNDVLNRWNRQSFCRIVSSLSKEQLMEFAKACHLSDGMVKVLMDTPAKYLNNIGAMKDLGAAATNPDDLRFVAMLKGSILNDRFSRSSFSFGIKAISRRLMYAGMGNSEGAGGVRIASSVARVTRTSVKLGLKGTAKIAKKVGASERTVDIITYAQAPIRHTFNAVKTRKAIRANTRTIKSGKLASKFARMQERIASKMAARLGVKAGASATSGGSAAAVTTAEAGGAAEGSAAGAGGAAGGAAAGGGLSAAAVVLIIVVAVIAIMIIIGMICDNEETKRKTNASYNFVENTEIVDELTAELDAMNTQFNVLINDAKNHRGNFASSVSYEGGETALTYESYTVIFRDAYGNELDPKTVDLNNTKAIIAMAGQYFPYPFPNHAAGGDASTSAQRKRYEEAKQMFKDYCYMLWASTHRITIEEYYPGDTDYSEYDDGGIATYLGKCDRNGETIWLPEDMEPRMITNSETGEKTVCEDCNEYLATGYGNFSKALCAHPFETYASTDGWKKTGRTSTHILCPGHRVTDYGTDENGNRIVDGHHYEYCGQDRTPIPQHQHTCYEWQYVCGGHMSAVVYVTIGDLSRLPAMGAAKDVDYDSVGTYKEE